MSDQVQLTPGARPWLPSAESEPVETLNYYDGPLLGIVRQQGVPYLFRCLAGELGSAQIWLYGTLTEHDSDALRTAEGDELDVVVDRLSRGPVTIALAGQTDGLLYWETQDLTHVQPADVPSVAAHRLAESIERIRSQTAHLAKSI
jgi:hypothetical protein